MLEEDSCTQKPTKCAHNRTEVLKCCVNTFHLEGLLSTCINCCINNNNGSEEEALRDEPCLNFVTKGSGRVWRVGGGAKGEK